MNQRPAAHGPVELAQPVLAVIAAALPISPAAALEEAPRVEALAARRVAKDEDGRRLPAIGAPPAFVRSNPSSGRVRRLTPTELDQLPRPVMHTRTGFHADQAKRLTLKNSSIWLRRSC